MANLQLSLKKQWFDLTKSGIKTEDYREITPYWVTRLVNHFSNYSNLIYQPHLVLAGRSSVEFKKFDSNIMTLGYPKSTNTERILRLEHKGIEIGYGRPEWGAEPNKLYFVIKHGELLK